MEQKEVISKLKILKEIRPEKNWVFQTKKEILGETSFIFPLLLKPAYFILFLIFLTFGLFGFSKNSLPGEPLFLIKKITEKAQEMTLPETEKVDYSLELAQKRLNELKLLAEKNETRKLPKAFKEVKESTFAATVNLLKSKNVNEKIIEKVLKFELQKQEIENKILATKIGIEEQEDPAKIISERLISELKERSLTEQQKEIFEKAKIEFENRNFAQSLILLSQLAR